MPHKKPTVYLVRGPLKKPFLLRTRSSLNHKIHELGLAMEKMKLAEYVELLNRPVRLLYINFIAGLARGVGMAIGFAILGALVIYTLQRLAILKLPVIGGFIADLVRIVQVQLKLGR